MARNVASSRASLSLRADERGSITVEYTVLLVVVALGCAVAIGGLGVPLFRMYLAHRAWLLLPMPYAAPAFGRCSPIFGNKWSPRPRTTTERLFEQG